MKVLISVLGKPFEKYKEVEWHLSGQSTRTRMPAQVLASVFQVDYTLILIPDSLGTGSTYFELQNPGRLLPDHAWEHISGKLYRFVLPSRYSVTVLGDVRDFYQACMLFLARWFAKHLSDPNEPLKLYLETSTGLNILQLMTYRAVHEIAGALAFFRKVSLEIYNADPVTGNTTQGEVFLTESYPEVRAALKRFAIKATPRWLEPYNNNSHPGEDPTYRNVRDALVQLWSGKDLVAFLNAIYYGIPLGIIRWFHENPVAIFDALRQIYRHFLAQAKDGNSRFLRPVRLGPDFAPYALGALLSHQLQTQWPFFSVNLKSQGATYEQMTNIMERMYWDHPIIRNRFEAERTIQPNELRCPSYPVLLKECGSFKDTSCQGVDKRNFFAHAGFEQCAVEVDKKAGEIHFRFAQEKESTIQSFLSKG